MFERLMKALLFVKLQPFWQHPVLGRRREEQYEQSCRSLETGYDRRDPRLKDIESFGPHPDRLLVFADNMHFVERLTDPGVPKFASDDRQAGTAEEIKAAFMGTLGLFGTYTVDDEGEFTGNHVEGSSFPSWNGNTRDNTDLIEVVDGDTITEIFHDGDLTVHIAGNG
jgi:hypothetical protein